MALPHISLSPLLQSADEQLQRLPVPTRQTVFVHGDLWHGNTRWSGDKCQGMVDWGSSGAGHYGVDLGSMRLDATLNYGQPAADLVLDGWQQAMGEEAEDVAYFDLVAALNTSADMSGIMTALHAQGRSDLDLTTLIGRRDEFLQTALNHLGND